MLMLGVSPGSGVPGEVKRNSHVSLVSGGKEDSAMQSSENNNRGPGSTSPNTLSLFLYPGPGERGAGGEWLYVN